MTITVKSASSPSPQPGRRWHAWVPGLATLAHYQRAWLLPDVVAGLVLTAVLIPVGMGYAEASGVPAIYGLYATIVPLLVYAVFGPSRIMVLGPDSTLAAVIAALIVPLAGGNIERSIALAGLLAVLSGSCALIIGLLRLGLVADLLSKPIRIGFLNAIAVTVIIGQLPKLLGFSAKADSLPQRLAVLVQGIADRRTSLVALTIGATCLVLILVLKRIRPAWPGVLLAVVGATLATTLLHWSQPAQLAVVGTLPQGLPGFVLPEVSLRDAVQLMPGAVIIAMLTFADTSVLSRALAQRGNYRVSQNQEIIALGIANIAAGLFQGFSISSSASRTPVAEAAGAKTQITGVVGALAITLLLLAAPTLVKNLPTAALAAIVIAACISFGDFAGMWAMRRQSRREFGLAIVSFLGVALIGVIAGIFITIALSVMILVWNVWHPYSAVLVRVDGQKGYHDSIRHPEGRAVPGLVLFRWDAQLIFANAEIFRDQVIAAVKAAPWPAHRVVVASDAITEIDLTAAEVLVSLFTELREGGVELCFAGMKGQVKDQLRGYGTLAVI
nr:SulP family inorganic anion transporter [Kofleriaceae bacterium]